MEEKREQKRSEIIAVMKTYADENGNIDLTKLRTEVPKVYARISYYFGSIDQALIEAQGGNSGAPVNRMTLRNQLAHDHLKYLKEDLKLTFEEIGNRYGVTRAHVSQLSKSLEKTFGNKEQEAE